MLQLYLTFIVPQRYICYIGIEYVRKTVCACWAGQVVVAGGVRGRSILSVWVIDRCRRSYCYLPPPPPSRHRRRHHSHCLRRRRIVIGERVSYTSDCGCEVAGQVRLVRVSIGHERASDVQAYSGRDRGLMKNYGRGWCRLGDALHVSIIFLLPPRLLRGFDFRHTARSRFAFSSHGHKAQPFIYNICYYKCMQYGKKKKKNDPLAMNIRVCGLFLYRHHCHFQVHTAPKENPIPAVGHHPQRHRIDVVVVVDASLCRRLDSHRLLMPLSSSTGSVIAVHGQYVRLTNIYIHKKNYHQFRRFL